MGKEPASRGSQPSEPAAILEEAGKYLEFVEFCCEASRLTNAEEFIVLQKGRVLLERIKTCSASGWAKLVQHVRRVHGVSWDEASTDEVLRLQVAIEHISGRAERGQDLDERDVRDARLALERLRVSEPNPSTRAKTASGKRPKRSYVKQQDAERIAKDKFDALWRIDNKSYWARVIGCHRDTVRKLRAWHRAEKKRQGFKKIETRLRGIMDPAIMEALYSSDASALGNLSVEVRDWMDGLSDDRRDEVVATLEESWRDAVS